MRTTSSRRALLKTEPLLPVMDTEKERKEEGIRFCKLARCFASGGLQTAFVFFSSFLIGRLHFYFRAFGC